MSALVVAVLLGSACEANPAKTNVPLEADIRRAQALSLNCQSCHVANSPFKDAGSIPDYTHLSQEDLAGRLIHYKTTNDGSVMHRLMSGYSQADIENLSHYLTRSAQRGTDE